jgi:hypothetical protein
MGPSYVADIREGFQELSYHPHDIHELWNLSRFKPSIYHSQVAETGGGVRLCAGCPDNRVEAIGKYHAARFGSED